MAHRLRALLLLVPLTGGCATLSMQETGFLDGYSRLEPAADRTVAFIPDEVTLFQLQDAPAFDSVFVAPPVVRLASDSQAELDDDDIERLTTAFSNYLRRALERDYRLVDAPDERTAVVRAAVTDVDPSNVYWNIVGVILVVPFDMGGISGEIEVTHPEASEPLLQMKACRAGTPFLIFECFQRWGHAYHGMMKWSRTLRTLMREAAAAPPSGSEHVARLSSSSFVR